MLLCWDIAPKQKTVQSSVTCFVHLLLYNAEKHMFTRSRLAAFIIKQKQVTILIFMRSFVKLFNENVSWSSTLDFLAILGGPVV
jgi:hypothetical protein